MLRPIGIMLGPEIDVLVAVIDDDVPAPIDALVELEDGPEAVLAGQAYLGANGHALEPAPHVASPNRSLGGRLTAGVDACRRRVELAVAASDKSVRQEMRAIIRL